MLHEPRQRRSWLIFDVSQKKMPSNSLAQIPRRRAFAYGAVAAAILISGCIWMLYLDIPLWRVLLEAGKAIVALLVPFAIFSLTSGERSDRPSDSAGVRRPVRYLKALPFFIAAILILAVATAAYLR
jgi:uncharacterized membrane protein (DUF4010 family)